MLEVRACDFGMVRIELQRDNAPALGKPASKPDGAISAQRADLQNPPRAGDAHQQLKKLALQP